MTETPEHKAAREAWRGACDFYDRHGKGKNCCNTDEITRTKKVLDDLKAEENEHSSS